MGVHTDRWEYTDRQMGVHRQTDGSTQTDRWSTQTDRRGTQTDRRGTDRHMGVHADRWEYMQTDGVHTD